MQLFIFIKSIIIEGTFWITHSSKNKRSDFMKFKKILSVISACCLLCGSSLCVKAEDIIFEKSDAQVYIDNEIVGLNNKPMEYDGGKWLPLNELCEYLNYDIQFDSDKNSVLIIPGDNCKNSDGLAERIEFEVGSEEIKMYSGEYENDITNTYTNIDSVYSPLSYKLNDEIYMPAYYMCRMLDLKLKRYSALEPNTIKIYTRNYINLEQENSRPNITVTKSLTIAADGVIIPFIAKPFIDENGRTLVPVRELCELLNYRVMWFDAPGRVAVSSVPIDEDKMYGKADSGCAGGDGIWFTIGEKQYRINGAYYEMDTAAQIVDNRTYVPLRILADFLGYDVVYVPVSGS